MTTMSQGNKKITTRKIPATNNKVLVRTGSLRFFNKYRQPIEKCWSVPVPVRETVRIIKPWPCWQDYLLLASPGIYPQVYHRTRKKQRRDRIISNFTKRESFSCLIYQPSYNLAMCSPFASVLHPLKKGLSFPFSLDNQEDNISGNSIERSVYWFILKISSVLPVPTGRVGIEWWTLL